MAKVESAWEKYPDYEINLVPSRGVARVWYGDLLLAESDACVRLEEMKHVDRLYFPEEHVRWEHFTANDHHSVCPFKGEADYWHLTAVDPPEENLVWAYRTPFEQVGGIEGYVCFYEDRVRVEVEEAWDADDPDARTVNRFPIWGDASDLLRLIDVQPNGPHRFVGPPYGDTTRNVVEGGQLLAEAIVAASKTVPDQSVTSAYMIFSKAAAFDAPIDLSVEVLRGGRTYSTVQVRADQDGQLRSAGLLLLDRGAPSAFEGQVAMPDVAGPEDAPRHDMRVTGRDLRIVDGAYSQDPDLVAPAELYAWIRFRDAPDEQYLHRALLAQPTTHWTIAAAMLPHPGVSEAQAHVTLSTGIMSTSIAFHADVDVSQWLLYANPAIFAGNGHAQGEGHVFTRDGKLVASYTVQAMVRAFTTEPESMGKDYSNAM